MASSNPLAEIIRTSERTHASIGKTAVPAPVHRRPRGEDLFQALAESLSTMHAQLQTQTRETRSAVEIEVRVGLISQTDRLQRHASSAPGSGAIRKEPDGMREQNLRFVSGVSPADFEAVKDEIGRKYGTVGRSRTETVFLYDKGYMRNSRVIVDGVSPTKLERKETFKLVNFEMPAAPYDLRVQASVEQQTENMQGDDPPGDWSKRRTKRRVSWTSPAGVPEEQSWLWQADLTKVEEASPGGPVSEVQEVELELLPHVRDRWLELSDSGQVIAMTSNIATHLCHLLESINPIEPLSTIADLVKEPIDAHCRKAAVAACSALKRPVGKASAFPGAQPINMCKRDVSVVQRSSYYVAEKTDGVRYLLMAVADGNGGETCVMVDRSMNVFRVTGGPFLASVLGLGTVLDGELVHNRSKARASFVAFDILRHLDADKLELPFVQRLGVLRDNVMAVYVERTQGGGRGDGAAEIPPHIPLAMKSFVPRKDIMKLFRKMHVDGKHRVFRDEARGLHHKTDGIIFQPNKSYKMGTDTSLLKWKWVDLASVDLRVYETSDGLRLCTEAGQQGDEVDLSRTIHLAPQDQARLHADMSSSQRRSVIAEVALDPGSGLWVYMGLRPDKDRPNYVTTVMSTMVEVAEGLSEEELKYRMLADTPGDDDWGRQESSMRKRAVVWQCKRKAPRDPNVRQHQHPNKRPRGPTAGELETADGGGSRRRMNGHG